MRVLGSDAGYTAPGFAVVEYTDLDRLQDSKILHTQCVITRREIKRKGKNRGNVSEDDARRIQQICDVLRSIVVTFRPDYAIVELPTGGSMGATALKCMAMATAMSVAALRMLDVKSFFITPFTNKKQSTGDSYATKEQVISAIHRVWIDVPWPKKILRGRVQVYPDDQQQEAVADALSTIIAFSSLVRLGNINLSRQIS
jgi:Holliday junction resolvasome RuvABC endonuclease subunit